MLNKIKEKLVEPFNHSARFLHKLGFTPTTTTLFGLLSAIVSGASYYGARHLSEMIYVALAFLVVSGFFDTVDGAIARLYGHVTRFGGVLDSVSDRIEEIAIFVGIVAGGLVSAPIGLLALAGSLMVSYVRARVESEDANMSGVGFAERPERLIILACATVVRRVDIGVIIIAIVTWVTVAQRMMNAHKQLR
jgi:archaetidylinositol phosphate synthase